MYHLFGIRVELVRYRRLPEQLHLFSITSMVIFLNVAVDQLLINYNTELIIHSRCLNFKSWWSLHGDISNHYSLSLFCSL